LSIIRGEGDRAGKKYYKKDKQKLEPMAKL